MRRVAVVALLMLLTPPAWALAPCASEAEREAMAMRALQSEFMMAGVACNQAKAYNEFVTRFQPVLTREGQVLKGYFRRAYGPGERGLNDFITALANAWSQVHMADMSGFCKSTWERMWRATHEPTERSDLIKQARARSVLPLISTELCPGTGLVQTAQSTPPAKRN